jgi:antagonist of KipI
VAVGGGIAVPPVLGSASTHVASALGGVEGRALRRGDRLPLGPPPAGGEPGGATVPLRRLDPLALARLAWPQAANPPSAPAGPPAIRVTRGAQWDAIPAATRQAFFTGPFTVSVTSDRMGIRLDGTRLENAGGGHMVTEGMPLGAIQVPPGGQPVILFVDHQTTGGYPVIAAVISADLPHLGQMRPGEPVRFAPVTFEEARALLLDQARWLDDPGMVTP